MTRIAALFALAILCPLLTHALGTDTHVWAHARAHRHYTNKDFARAQKSYQHLVTQDPSDTRAITGLANSFYAQQQFDVAKNYYEELTHRALSAHEEEENWFNLGCAQAQLKEYKQALDSFEHVLKLNPKNTRAAKNRDILKKLLEQQKNSPQKQPQKTQHDKPAQDRKDDTQQGKSDQRDQQANNDRRDQKHPDKNTNTQQNAPKNESNGNGQQNEPEQQQESQHTQPPDQQQKTQHDQFTPKPASAQLSQAAKVTLEQVKQLEKQGQKLYAQALAGAREQQDQYGW